MTKLVCINLKRDTFDIKKKVLNLECKRMMNRRSSNSSNKDLVNINFIETSAIYLWRSVVFFTVLRMQKTG